MPTSNRPEIANWLQQIEAVTAEAARMRTENSPAELCWKLSPSAWSISEVFDHLRITSDGYVPRIRACLESKSKAGQGKRDVYRRTWFGRFFIGLLEPGNNRKIKAPSRFAPTAATVGGEAIDRFIETQTELETLVRAAEDIELGGRRLASPITPVIRFTIGEMFDLLTTHQRRHLGQAQRTEQTAKGQAPSASA